MSLIPPRWCRVLTGRLWCPGPVPAGGRGVWGHCEGCRGGIWRDGAETPPGRHLLLGESFLCRGETLQRPSTATGHGACGLAPDSHAAEESWPSCPHPPSLLADPRAGQPPSGVGAPQPTAGWSVGRCSSLPRGVRLPVGTRDDSVTLGSLGGCVWVSGTSVFSL